MKYALLIIISFFTFLVSGQNHIDPDYKDMIERKYSFPTISQDSAQALMKANAAVFLDTREIDEYNVSHIPNAIFTGYDDFQWSKLKNIDTNELVIVYCSIGVRSQNIAQKLSEKGYTRIYNLYGGIFLWADQGRPMLNSEKNKTKTIHGYNKFWGRWVKIAPKVYE